MQIGPFTLARTKRLPLAPLSSRGSWFPLIRESFLGAWQTNVTVTLTDVLTHPTVFSCLTLIINDVAKLCMRLVEVDADGIWTATDSPAFSPVLRRPNRYQNFGQFVKSWLLAKLISGNTYVLKERDQRGVVVALYVLDPLRVTPLVTPDGAVYYELQRDDLSGLSTERIIVPAKEIIHDRMYCLYHPLIGLSPLFASGVAAMLGLKIQTNSANFFGNGSQPGGVLTAPGVILDSTAARLKAYWDTNFTGANVGKVAVLGDGLKYEPMATNAVDAQLSEQWKNASEAIAACFHVPKYLVGVGEVPAYGNIQSLYIQYYSQCLQDLIEALERCLDDGLGLGPAFGNAYGTEFDLDDLLRMDSAMQMDVIAKGTGAGVMKPNEGRRKLNFPPVAGGDVCYAQQQQFSLEALNRRDTAPPAAVVAPVPPALPPVAPDDTMLPKFAAALYQKVAEWTHAA